MVPMSELENLPTDIQDLAVSTPEEAKKASRLADILPEDYYTVIIQDWDWGRKDGRIDESFLELKTLEIVDAENTRLIGRKIKFQRVWTKPYPVKSDPTGRTTTSGLGELLAGIDDTKNWSVPGDPQGSVKNATEMLNEAAANRTPIRQKYQWEAFDKDYFDSRGGRDLDKPQQKELRKQSTLKGMRNFPVNEAGDPIPVWVGPSGATVEARLVLDRSIPSSRRK